jgi:phospholipid transport system transporter-binding protein
VSTSAGFRLEAVTPSTLAVHGVLDFDTASVALAAVRAALESETAELDLAGVSHSDSAGLACVLAAVAEANGRGRSLRVVGMPAGMRALAQVCEVDTLLA